PPGRAFLCWAIWSALPICVGLGVAAWLWQRGPAPDPPEAPLAGVGPRVAELIREQGNQVRGPARAGAAWGRLGQVYRVHGFDEQAVACWTQAERFDSREPRWPYYR